MAARDVETLRQRGQGFRAVSTCSTLHAHYSAKTNRQGEEQSDDSAGVADISMCAFVAFGAGTESGVGGQRVGTGRASRRSESVRLVCVWCVAFPSFWVSRVTRLKVPSRVWRGERKFRACGARRRSCASPVPRLPPSFPGPQPLCSFPCAPFLLIRAS